MTQCLAGITYHWRPNQRVTPYILSILRKSLYWFKNFACVVPNMALHSTITTAWYTLLESCRKQMSHCIRKLWKRPNGSQRVGWCQICGQNISWELELENGSRKVMEYSINIVMPQYYIYTIYYIEFTDRRVKKDFGRFFCNSIIIWINLPAMTMAPWLLFQRS